MSDTPQVLLGHHLKALRLPTFLREYDKVARQCAAEGADHVRYLVRLAELELIDRERRMVERRIKQAKFPAVKSLDSFDFKAMPSLNKMLVRELARCEYVDRRENVIALGNSGTGKTHIALGLGLAACQKGLFVGFITAAALVHELMEAGDEKRLLRFQKQLAKYQLLIIDELGFVPLSKTGRRFKPEGEIDDKEVPCVLTQAQLDEAAADPAKLPEIDSRILDAETGQQLVWNEDRGKRNWERLEALRQELRHPEPDE